MQGPFQRRMLSLAEHGGKPAADGTVKGGRAAGSFLSPLPVPDMCHHPLLRFMTVAVLTNRSTMSY